MDRRDFLKIAGTVATTGLIGGCGQVGAKIIPYLVPPDDGINPVEGWRYATTCRMCPAGCGVIVRVVEGRAKKVEGNRDHPINHGGLCARGQAAVQQVYHPERLLEPLRRKPGTARGENVFEAITWEDALTLFAEKIGKAGDGTAYAIVGDAGDVETAITKDFLHRLGSGSLFAPDFRGAEIHQNPAANEAGTNSMAGVPYYDLSQAAFALLLGADIFENSQSPVHYSWAFGQMRRGDPTHRGALVYAGHRISMTAAVADSFIAVKPGSLGILAMGIAGGVVRQADKNGDFDHLSVASRNQWIKATEKYDASAIYRRTRVSPADLAFLVDHFMVHQPGIVIPGDDVALTGGGATSLKSVAFLNLILRELARSRGQLAGTALWPTNGDLPERMRRAVGASDVSVDTKTFADKMTTIREKGSSLGLIFNANPIHQSPTSFDVAGAFSKTDFVVSAGLFLNDTTRFADLVFPVPHFLEAWGAQVPVYPWRAPVFNMQQPVIGQHGSLKSFGDLLITAGNRAGLKLRYTGVEAMIHELIENFRAEWPEVSPSESMLGARESILMRGGWWPEEEKKISASKPDVDQLWSAAKDAHPADPVSSADNENRPFHLIPYHTLTMGDGLLANLPWLMELPEPMTRLSWGSWVEINPETAMQMDVKEGDILRLTSSYGSITAPATLYPGTPPNAVAVPFGYGHKSFGKYATGRGANAVELFGPGDEELGGAIPWRGLKVTVIKTGVHQALPREADSKGEYEGEVFQL